MLALGALTRQGVADAADAFELVTRAELGREQLDALQAPPPPPLATAPRTRSMAVPRSGPQIPDGMYRLFLQVADDAGQQAEQELRLRVGTSS